MKAWISRAALQGTRVGFKTPFQQRWLSLAQQQDVGILELAGFKPSLGSGGFEVTIASHALVAQLDRASPSEGEGHRFESCRARHPLSQNHVFFQTPLQQGSGAFLLLIFEPLKLKPALLQMGLKVAQ